VISYELYCQIQLYYKERGLSFAQIGRELNLDEETVAKWARQKTYCQHLRARRKSKLDPYKPIIQRWLEQHPYSAAQIFQRLRAEQAYTGGISILTEQAPVFRIKIKSMWSGSWNCKGARNPIRCIGSQHQDLRGGSDIYVKTFGLPVARSWPASTSARERNSTSKTFRQNNKSKWGWP
jgi:hypothetical protein